MSRALRLEPAALSVCTCVHSSAGAFARVGTSVCVCARMCKRMHILQHACAAHVQCAGICENICVLTGGYVPGRLDSDTQLLRCA